MRALASRRRRVVFVLAAASGLASVLLGACIATAPEGILRQTDQDGGSDPIVVDDGGAKPDVNLDAANDPHAVIGTDPSHGPFAGGQRVIVYGNGFTSNVRVWFGDTEVDTETLVPIDPTRVQVSAPAGPAGPVDVTAQNADDESTRRTLPAGYVYDTFFAAPSEGPVSGGSVIEIIGNGTKWDASTKVKIDGKPCTAQTFDSPTLIGCTVPAGSPGSKPIMVTTGQENITVLDAWTYEDSDNGYKGGLSGAPLAGELTVLVYDNFSGNPVPNAYAIVGTTIATALVQQADFTGVAIIKDPSLDSPKTVTVAAKCMSPISFVDVPVDTVTVYLDPVLSPECASEGDPPPVGGKPVYTGTVFGQLVWGGGVEFKKGPWSNVPAPNGPNEGQVAYVFAATNDPTQPFTLPDALLAITPDSPGSIGYEFDISTLAGNRALYAIAGIQDSSTFPPKFTAYAMGLVKGVPVVPDDFTENVYISMSKTLDKMIQWDVVAPPPGPKGPDRLRGTVALMLGNDGYAILPTGQKTPLLPITDLLNFIGVPSLDGDLFGSSYISTARAVTGPTYTAPLSVLTRMLTTTTSTVLPVKDFVGVPTLGTPAPNTDWDGMHLATSFPAVGPPIDLSVYDIISGNGLVRWTVVVPLGSHSVELPDISGFDMAGLPPGSITVGVYGARVDGFDYSNLKYRDIRPQGMTAYSLDYFPAHL